METDGIAERAIVHARERVDEQRAQLVERARLLVEELTRHGQYAIQLEPLRTLADDLHGLSHRRGERGPEREVVGSAHQVERRPHQGGANHLPRLQRLVQVRAPEPLDAGPQPDERRFRLLPLQPAEPLDGLDGRDRFSRQQQLARQRGAVELPAGERLRHRRRRASLPWPRAPERPLSLRRACAPIPLRARARPRRALRGALVEGELERAREWGRTLVAG